MRPHLDTHGRGPRWFAPLAVALIWGVNVPVMKAALGRVDPFVFNALRLTLSALALGVADRLERGRGDAPAPRIPWLAVVGLGLLTSLVYQVFFIQGMARTSASHTGFLVASGPLWTASIARLLGVERLVGRAWAGLGVAFVGTCLVASAKGGGGTVETGSTLLGNGLVLAAMIAWALGTVLSRPVLSDFPATRLAFLFTCVALPGHWLLAWPRLADGSMGAGPDAGSAGWSVLGAGEWIAVVYSGVLSTGIAYALWHQSVLRNGPARTSAFTNLVPLVALAVAWAALGERPGPVQLAGGALVCIGIASWQSARKRRSRTEAATETPGTVH